MNELMHYIYPDLKPGSDQYRTYGFMLEMPDQNKQETAQNAKNAAFNRYFPLYIHRLAAHLRADGTSILAPALMDTFFVDENTAFNTEIIPYAKMRKLENPRRNNIDRLFSTHANASKAAGSTAKPAATKANNPGTSRQHAMQSKPKLTESRPVPVPVGLNPRKQANASAAPQTATWKATIAKEHLNHVAREQQRHRDIAAKVQQQHATAAQDPPAHRLPPRRAPDRGAQPVDRGAQPVDRGPQPLYEGRVGQPAAATMSSYVYDTDANNRSPRVKSVFNNNEGLVDWGRRALEMMKNPNPKSYPRDDNFMKTGFLASMEMYMKTHDLLRINYHQWTPEQQRAYAMKQGVFPRGMVEYMYNSSREIVGSGANGELRVASLGPHKFIIKKMQTADSHLREQDAHLQVYDRLSGYQHITIPWMTPAPYAVQTLADEIGATAQSVTLYKALHEKTLREIDKKVLAAQLRHFLISIHWHGIIHNDLGGNNLMVTFDRNHVKLVVVDWGQGEIFKDAPLTPAILQRTRWAGPQNPRCDYIWGLEWQDAKKRKQGMHEELWIENEWIRHELKWDEQVPLYRQGMHFT